MMTRAHKLKEELPGVQAILKGQGSTAQLRTLLTEVKALHSNTGALGEWESTLSLFPKEMIATAAKLCQDNVERLLESTEVISGWQLDRDRLQLKGAITKGDAAARQILAAWQNSWSNSIREEFSGLTDLAKLLDTIRGCSGAAEKLRKAVSMAERTQSSAAPHEAERKNLLAARALREEALESLSESGADHEVVKFLTAVAKRNCPLELGTPIVVKWLKEKGQLMKFRILHSGS